MTTYYSIDIQKRGGEKWTIDKRYAEFDALHLTLKKSYPNLPNLPKKTILAVKTPQEIDKRRGELEVYIQVRYYNYGEMYRKLQRELT
jgi:hypothetical protein